MNWKDLSEEIGIPAATLEAMAPLEPAPASALTEDPALLQDPRGLRRLKRLLLLALDAREEYARRGIPDEIFLAGCRDFPIWCRDYLTKQGAAGFAEFSWLARTVHGKLFRLGRLQFEPLTLETDLAGHPAGTPVLEVHIPAGEPLEEDAVAASFAAAPDFFRRYFGRDDTLCHCHSWLLSPALKEILPESSRILRFQSLFDLAAQDRSERQAEERVFGFVTDDFSAYPEHTSLQRAMKAYLLSGGVLTMGHGLRKI